MNKTGYNLVYRKDARKLNELLKDKVVDVTITSPPYFDLKDYGHKQQIGYGQEYFDYLEDLKTVFKSVYDCTKDNGTLWVIIDSFRKDNEVTPLPFDFSNKLKDIGWKLQEVIIWAKDRTVPWAHQGQMRNLFEYVLLFSKKEKYNFFIDEVRDFVSLKKWWIRYPERYNPKGKTPDGLWHFEIPTQGSWGKGYIKHFCPLPEEMIAQILKISTKEGHLVLDPFAGSGAVLAKAQNMKRNYIGFELNKDYINMFKKYIKATGEQKRKLYIQQKRKNIPQNKFNDLILELRALKYPRIILQRLPSKMSKQIERVYVKEIKNKPTKKNARTIVSYTFLVSDKASTSELIKKINKITSIAPLSKFGIQPTFKLLKTATAFKSNVGEKTTIYTYTNKITHKFKSTVRGKAIPTLSKTEIILSKIKVDINEKDYE